MLNIYVRMKIPLIYHSLIHLKFSGGKWCLYRPCVLVMPNPLFLLILVRALNLDVRKFWNMIIYPHKVIRGYGSSFSRFMVNYEAMGHLLVFLMFLLILLPIFWLFARANRHVNYFVNILPKFNFYIASTHKVNLGKHVVSRVSKRSIDEVY